MPTMKEETQKWEKQYWRKRFREASGNDVEWKKVYVQYLKNAIWLEIRQKALERAGFRCERCHTFHGSNQSKLHVHHKQYDRIGGFEKDSDLEVVCAGDCHQTADEEREERVEQERGEAIYQIRFESWGNARYKDSWDKKKYEYELGAEEEFHRFAYKDWCEKNKVRYHKSRKIPDEFIELLMENRDDEYEEYQGDMDSWYQ
jgi:hypothetical protein